MKREGAIAGAHFARRVNVAASYVGGALAEAFVQITARRLFCRGKHREVP